LDQFRLLRTDFHAAMEATSSGEVQTQLLNVRFAPIVAV
jgi:hypothetical protein